MAKAGLEPASRGSSDPCSTIGATEPYAAYGIRTRDLPRDRGTPWTGLGQDRRRGLREYRP